MLQFAIKRLLLGGPTALAVLTVIFILVRVAPGDPAQTVLGDQASQEAIEAMRVRLGLNKPMHEQYVEFIVDMSRGQWGDSLISGRPVLTEIAAVLPFTIELTLASVLLSVVIGIPLGAWSAARRDTAVDYATRILSLLALSFPAFVSGILLLLVFAIKVPWFPVISAAEWSDPAERLRSLALPAINLGLIMAAFMIRVTRSSMLEVLGEDYVRTAKAKGLAESRIIAVHALRNALIPIVTVIGLFIGILIGNSVLTEIVFSRPGLGKLIVGALSQRDYTLLQGLMVFYALIVVVVNVLTDLAYGLVDPRVKNQ